MINQLDLSFKQATGKTFQQKPVPDPAFIKTEKIESRVLNLKFCLRFYFSIFPYCSRVCVRG